MNVDCTRCDELLLDHAYGELDEVTDAAVQKHVDGCARCSAAMSDVSIVREACRAIEIPEPPLALDAAILAAAATAARTPEKVAAPRTIAVERPVSLASRFLSSFAALAMRPQMAMAAVLVVVVGVALLVGQDARLSTEDALPSAGLQAPATPAFEPPPSPTVTLEPVPPAAVAVPDRAPAAPAEEPALRPLEDRNEEQLQGRRGPSSLAQETPSEDRRSVREELARADAPMRRSAESGETITKSVPAPSQGASGGGLAAPTGQARASAPLPQGGLDRGDGDAVASAEEERSVAPGGRASFDSGIGNYNRNRYRDAADDLGAFIARPGDALSLMPTARITRARSLKAIGRWADAVREYEEYLRRWGSGGNAAEARVEAADCYTRMGQTSRAQELYAQAENQAGASSSTRERARRARVSLESQAPSTPSAAPPAASAPADADSSF